MRDMTKHIYSSKLLGFEHRELLCRRLQLLWHNGTSSRSNRRDPGTCSDESRWRVRNQLLRYVRQAARSGQDCMLLIA